MEAGFVYGGTALLAITQWSARSVWEHSIRPWEHLRSPVTFRNFLR